MECQKRPAIRAESASTTSRLTARCSVAFDGIPEELGLSIASAMFSAPGWGKGRASLKRADDGSWIFAAVRLTVGEAERGLRRFKSWRNGGPA